MCIRDRTTSIRKVNRSFLRISLILNAFFRVVSIYITSAVPVSYTHLDVYKRQYISSALGDCQLHVKLAVLATAQMSDDKIRIQNFDILISLNIGSVYHLSLIHISLVKMSVLQASVPHACDQDQHKREVW